MRTPGAQPEIRRLSPRDATNLYMHQGGVDMVIGWLAVFDAHDDADRTSYESIRTAIARRVVRVPRLRQRIRPLRAGLGRPIWVDDIRFDPDRHIHHRRLPDVQGASDDLLLEQLEEVFAQPLDLLRPPWDVHVLTDRDDRAVAVVQRCHHAMADGAASAAIAAALMDLGPDPDATVWAPQPSPSSWQLLVDNLRRRVDDVRSAASRLRHPFRTARRAWDLARELRAMLAAQRNTSTTVINQPVGAHRRLAVTHGSLTAAIEAGRRHGATVNDVILTAAAGGLRRLLLARGDLNDDLSLQVAVPISIRGASDDGGLGNQTSSMVAPLHVNESEPAQRLEQIARDTARLKADRARLAINGLMDSAFVPPVVHRNVDRFTRGQRLVHLFVSNVPGPTDPLTLAGTTIGEVVPVVPVTGNVPIAIGAISYAGTLSFGIRHCPDRVPDIDVFIHGFTTDLERLSSEPETRTEPAQARPPTG